jgi:uncharacterized membrane protein YeiH
MSFLDWLFYLDFVGLLVFAATGALIAARGGHDIVTMLFFAAITGVGGGTLRDLLIGAPVFWVKEPAYILTCAFAAAAIWFGGRWLDRPRALIWMDAFGLAYYAVLGAAKAAALGVAAPICIVMGVLTATFGGVLRDIVAGQPSILLAREIYVTAALAGASTYVLTSLANAGQPIALLAGFLAGLVVRIGAISRGWAWPGYPAHSRPNGE